MSDLSFMRGLKASLAAAVMLFGLATTASAAVTFAACATLSPDATGKLSPNIGCQGILGIGSSQPNPGDVNAVPGMFGQTGWSEYAKIGKDDTGGANSVNGFTFASANGNKSGTWSITQQLRDGYDYIAIIMKDGNHLPTTSLAYLIGNTFSGVWDTPWVNCNPQGCKPNAALSNATLWVSGPTPVPLPAAAWLMLAALGGLGFLSRRRKAAEL